MGNLTDSIASTFADIHAINKANAYIRGDLGTGEPVADPFSVAGKQGYYWVRLRQGGFITLKDCYNAGVARLRNLPVLVEKVGDEYTIIGIDPKRIREYSQTNVLGTSVPPHSHEVDFGNIDYVSLNRLNEGRASVVGDMLIKFGPISNYTWNGSDYTWLGGTVDLREYVPSTPGKQVWCKIGFEATTQNILVQVSTEYALSVILTKTELAAVTFTSTANSISLLGARLYYGQTAITKPNELIAIQPLISGLSSAGATYIHDQTTPATTWTVTHNLNKYPPITIVDSSGRVVHGEITYTSSNVITLSFSAAFSGKAYVN